MWRSIGIACTQYTLSHFRTRRTTPVIELAAICGLNLPAAVMISVFWSSVALILPTDCTTMLAYKHGYFTMRDISRSGVICTVLTLIASTAAVVLLAGVVF